MLGVLRITGGAILFLGALTILYLAIRPLGRPAASTAPAAASSYSPYATRGPGSGAGTGVLPATVKPAPSAATDTPPASPAASASPATGPLGAQAQA